MFFMHHSQSADFFYFLVLHRARIITFPVLQLAPTESHGQGRNMLRCNVLQDDVYGTIADFIVRRSTLLTVLAEQLNSTEPMHWASATANLLSVALRRSSGRDGKGWPRPPKCQDRCYTVTISCNHHRSSRQPGSAAADFFMFREQ